jgi:hypothetical protein
MHRTLLLATACTTALAAGTGVNAQSAGAEDGVPPSAFFVGVGASYSFANFATQSVYNKGVSTVFQSGVPTASGVADGPAVQTPMASQSTPALVAQLGYFRRFGDSNFLWGSKLSYSYLGMSSTIQNLVIPQFGTSTAAGVSTFDGYSVTGSYSVAIYNQTTFLPFVGYASGKAFLYAGAGPSVSQIKASLDSVVGFATINGTLTNISGPPQSFSSTNWTVGAAGALGLTYFLTPSWFLDLNYSFTAPNARTIFATSPFSNPGTGTTSFAGTLIGNYSANLSTHAIALTINRAF